jgi:hypothetical protein
MAASRSRQTTYYRTFYWHISGLAGLAVKKALAPHVDWYGWPRSHSARNPYGDFSVASHWSKLSRLPCAISWELLGLAPAEREFVRAWKSTPTFLFSKLRSSQFFTLQVQIVHSDCHRILIIILQLNCVTEHFPAMASLVKVSWLGINCLWLKSTFDSFAAKLVMSGIGVHPSAVIATWKVQSVTFMSCSIVLDVLKFDFNQPAMFTAGQNLSETWNPGHLHLSTNC